jgi:hypothetical protein
LKEQHNQSLEPIGNKEMFPPVPGSMLVFDYLDPNIFGTVLTI